MILQYLKLLKDKRIVLASSSPRRKEILEKLGWNLMIIPSEFEENLQWESFSHPGDYVVATARGKANEVTKRLEKCGEKPYLVIASDTCVSLETQVFGKPKDRHDAQRMLSLLSGKTHDVISGVSAMLSYDDGWHEIVFYEKTKVHFGRLAPEEISSYIDTGEPMDKAGGYGIQALGGTLIEGIEGDYYNVMGFPLHKFCSTMAPYFGRLVK
ncbi:hypothetical protein SK128_024199 [Halocaridina rubra]|uniref:Uncharacterized protein n=1 Tax=Halocaridina rubra TaxID=373956 RepID=A0AAN8XG27_HALRR